MGAREEWAAHWRVVAGSGIAFGTGYALFGYVSSLFIEPLSQEMGWTRGDISTASAIGLVGGLAAPLIGRATDRFGTRPTAVVCFILLALVYLGFAAATASLALLFVLMACFAMVGAGTGGLTLTRPISSLFSASRGLALAVTLAGVTVTATLLPPVLREVIDTVSWRAGYLMLAGLCLLVAIPAILFLVHERAEPPKPGPALPTAYPGRKLDGLWKSRDFLVLAGALLVMNAPASALVTQMVPLLTDMGLTRRVAAGLLSVLAVSVLVGRIGSGLLLDRLPPRWVAAVFTSLPAIGCLMLVAVPELTPAVAVVAVVLVGLQQGSETDLLAFFTVRQFGMRRYSSIYGAGVMMGLLGTAVGVWFMGWVHGATGSYDIGLWLGVGLFPLAGALFLLLARRPVIEEG